MQASEAERCMVEGACRLHLRERHAPSTAFGGSPPPLRGGGESYAAAPKKRWVWNCMKR